MSGFEIAGVVLGSIPLVISALEHYADGVRDIKSMIHYEEVFLDIIVDLSTSEALFRQSCEDLLRSLMIPDNQFRDLVEKQLGWDDIELEMQVRDRLGSDFSIYRLKVSLLGKKIKLLRRKLQLGEDHGVPFMKNGVVDKKLQKEFFKTWRKVKGGFNAAKHKTLATEIREDINQIRELTKGAIELEESRAERTSSAISTYWEGIREHLGQIYKAFHMMWPRTCQLHVHQASLPLILPQAKSSVTPQRGFHFSLSRKDLKAPTNSRNDWWDVTIYSARAPIPQQKPTKKKFWQRKSTRFSLGANSPEPESQAKPQCQPAEKFCPTSTMINDLCFKLLHSHPSQCLGYMEVQKFHYHIHEVKLLRLSGDFTPMRDIFHRHDRTGLSTKERCKYSVALAAAVLQLYDTDWLNQSWTLEEVYYNPGSGDGQLYITRSFHTAVPSAASHITKVHLIKNEWLFSLGVALLELSQGKPLDHFQIDEDLDQNKQPHTLTRYSIADRLARKVREHESANFAKAVGKCIHPASDTYDIQLSNDGFRQNFYNDVVLPLKKDHDFLFQ